MAKCERCAELPEGVLCPNHRRDHGVGGTYPYGSGGWSRANDPFEAEARDRES